MATTAPIRVEQETVCPPTLLLAFAVGETTWTLGCTTGQCSGPGSGQDLGVGGVLVGITFGVGMSPWFTVLLASAGAVLLTVFEPVTWALTAELAGESRATANGMLATSNQPGAMTGASVGGVALAFGGFSLVGLFCLGAAVVAALGIGAKVRGIGALRAQVTGA